MFRLNCLRAPVGTGGHRRSWTLGRALRVGAIVGAGATFATAAEVPRPVVAFDPDWIGTLWAQPFGGSVAFSDHPSRMYISRGTPDTTRLISTTLPPDRTVDLGSAAVLNHELIFSACLADAEVVMATDGTASGTRTLISVPGGVDAHGLGNFLTAGPYVYFFAGSRSRFTPGLWRTDGTPEGTIHLVWGELHSLTAFNDQAWFIAGGHTGGGALMSSNGRLGGTQTIMTAASALVPSGDKLFWMRQLNATFLYYAPLGSGARFAAGLPLDNILELIGPGPQPGSVLLRAWDDEGGRLWTADGTIAGTRIAHESTPTLLNAVRTGGYTFAQRQDGAAMALWSTNGTSGGTQDLLTNPVGPDYASVPVVCGSRVYFAATDGVHGRELWISDGTPAGTAMVADLAAAGDSSLFGTNPTMVAVRNRIYFQARGRIPGVNFWSVNTRPADFDNSGGVGVHDVFSFVSSYLSGEDLADADGNGSVEVGDVYSWLAEYFADAASR